MKLFPEFQSSCPKWKLKYIKVSGSNSTLLQQSRSKVTPVTPKEILICFYIPRRQGRGAMSRQNESEMRSFNIHSFFLELIVEPFLAEIPSSVTIQTEPCYDECQCQPLQVSPSLQPEKKKNTLGVFTS